MAFRLARVVDRPVSTAYPDGGEHAADATRNLVTNPAVRDLTVTSSLFATLNLISGGRMELGIGRGDSSRRVLGKKPVELVQLETAVRIFREPHRSKEIEYEGQPTRLTWANIPPRFGLPDTGRRFAHGRPGCGRDHFAICRS